MSKNTGSLLFLYAETPLHVGSGQGLGAIDLPIQRERMSGHPIVPGSGLKGALRENIESTVDDRNQVHALLGPPLPEEGKRQEHEDHWASALLVGDARLLLFPMRSARGGFAWVTAPMVLDRLERDLHTLGGRLASYPRPAEGSEREVPAACAAPDSGLLVRGLDARAAIVLEDQHYRHQPTDLTELATWLEKNALPTGAAYAPFRQRLLSHLVIVSDTEFGHLVKHYTEVQTRVRMDQKTGTVERGALWTEEALPSESLLYSPLTYTHSRKKDTQDNALSVKETIEGWLSKHPRIWLGGDRTTGRGLIAPRLLSEAPKSELPRSAPPPGGRSAPTQQRPAGPQGGRR